MKGHNYTRNFIARTDAKKANGMVPLYLQCFINRDRVRIHLGIDVFPEHWNEKTQKIRIPDDPIYTEKLNSLLHKWERKAALVCLDAMENDQPLTGRMFKDRFLEKNKSGKLAPFIRRMIKKERPGVAKGTAANWEKTVNRMEKWRPDTRFPDIDIDWLEDYNRYLKSMDYEPNTVSAHHKIMRKFLYLAERKGYISDNPYKHFKIKKARTERVFLTEKEVQALINLYARDRLTAAKQRILRGFLYSCMTSLRYGDLKELRYRDIKGKGMVYRPQKTSSSMTSLTIPLNDHALRLIEDAKQDGRYGNNSHIFDVPSNQKMNTALGRIIELTGIDKHVTTHVGRHTFATLWLAAGNSVQVLQKIMGHENIKTTMVYVHILQDQKIDGLKQMGSMFRFPETNQTIPGVPPENRGSVF